MRSLFLTNILYEIFTFIHLADALSKATYSAFKLYIFCQYVCSLGIEPTTFSAANAMLYHWATETLIRRCTFLLMDYCHVLKAVWTLILTAPIHCRGSTGEQRYISPNLFWFLKNKQILRHFWPCMDSNWNVPRPRAIVRTSLKWLYLTIFLLQITHACAFLCK